MHTFVLTDLLLVAMLLAVAITPLSLFKGRRAHLPRLTPGVLTGAWRRRRRHDLNLCSALRRRGAQ